MSSTITPSHLSTKSKLSWLHHISIYINYSKLYMNIMLRLSWSLCEDGSGLVDAASVGREDLQPSPAVGRPHDVRRLACDEPGRDLSHKAKKKQSPTIHSVVSYLISLHGVGKWEIASMTELNVRMNYDCMHYEFASLEPCQRFRHD
jgi:hypothetical protein